MNHDREIFERIDELVVRQRVKQRDLIEYLGLTKGTYSNWARDTSTTYLSYIEEIAAYLKVDINYLVSGSFSKGTEAEATLSESEKKVLEFWRKAPPESQDFIVRLADLYLADLK